MEIANLIPLVEIASGLQSSCQKVTATTTSHVAAMSFTSKAAAVSYHNAASAHCKLRINLVGESMPCRDYLMVYCILSACSVTLCVSLLLVCRAFQRPTRVVNVLQPMLRDFSANVLTLYPTQG